MYICIVCTSLYLLPNLGCMVDEGCQDVSCKVFTNVVILMVSLPALNFGVIHLPLFEPTQYRLHNEM